MFIWGKVVKKPGGTETLSSVLNVPYRNILLWKSLTLYTYVQLYIHITHIDIHVCTHMHICIHACTTTYVHAFSSITV